ncbi:MAP/microtubule affinity-regulating kinase 3-like [Lepus europaeus]|uniref:MAP/microtubule affinity-regulating kinase 3-like n=1 Tax=Lepus europaeus TaxID=9983 RepID=UPI002B480F36|nr:MAP/microtubule affinity-regulating kinase 3-like [Lepus europaeus]XP_062040766.1 MAP/microtubule affinity-regulating kinase 3-like [Lepus europaeus]XP_062040767.1 MAP/microtubule affinity-regulating kinase 3-like [Lepus europaeus]
MSGDRSSHTEEEVFRGYEVLRTLGKGSFGKVKLARHMESGTMLAVKIIARGHGDSSESPQARVEAEIMNSLHHPHIVQLMQVDYTAEKAYLFMEYISVGDLGKLVAVRGHLEEGEACYYFSQTLEVVEYCHKQHIVHRDIKLENLLVDRNMCIKLTDFGLSKRLTEGQQLNSLCGSFEYCAPEEFLGKEFDGYKADVWSLGVLLYTMVKGWLPFEGDSFVCLKEAILAGSYVIPSSISGELEQLLDWLMTCDPAKRPTVADAMGHKWLRMEQKGPKLSEDAAEQSLSSTEDEDISGSVESLSSQEGLKEQDGPLWGQAQLKASLRGGGSEMYMGLPGPLHVTEGPKYRSGLLFQLGREEEDGCWCPALSWGKSQEGFSGAARPELTEVELLASPEDAEAQNYLVELGFQLSHKAASLTPSLQASAMSPVLPEGDQSSGLNACHGARRMDGSPPGMMMIHTPHPVLRYNSAVSSVSTLSTSNSEDRRSESPHPVIRRRTYIPGPVLSYNSSLSSIATISSSSSKGYLADRSCSQGVAENESLPENQQDEEAGTSPVKAAKSKGRRGICRRIVNCLLRVCCILPDPEEDL